MNPEHWREIERIYNLALERPSHERERLLDSECGGDASLRRDVDVLLRRTPSAQSFLNEPAVVVASQSVGEAAPSCVPAQIGRYRVTGTLGEGGMGIVYEAVDDSLGRAIALKVIRHDATDTSSARERFWREARVAARVNRPRICQIYE